MQYKYIHIVRARICTHYSVIRKHWTFCRKSFSFPFNIFHSGWIYRVSWHYWNGDIIIVLDGNPLEKQRAFLSQKFCVCVIFIHFSVEIHWFFVQHFLCLFKIRQITFSVPLNPIFFKANYYCVFPKWKKKLIKTWNIILLVIKVKVNEKECVDVFLPCMLWKMKQLHGRHKQILTLWPLE